jgi:hypothetical protein
MVWLRRLSYPTKADYSSTSLLHPNSRPQAGHHRARPRRFRTRSHSPYLSLLRRDSVNRVLWFIEIPSFIARDGGPCFLSVEPHLKASGSLDFDNLTIQCRSYNHYSAEVLSWEQTSTKEDVM